MRKLIWYVSSIFAGIAVWHIAVWGETLQSWSRFGAFLIFWSLLSIYYHTRKQSER